MPMLPRPAHGQGHRGFARLRGRRAQALMRRATHTATSCPACALADRGKHPQASPGPKEGSDSVTCTLERASDSLLYTAFAAYRRLLAVQRKPLALPYSAGHHGAESAVALCHTRSASNALIHVMPDCVAQCEARVLQFLEVRQAGAPYHIGSDCCCWQSLTLRFTRCSLACCGAATQ